MKNAPWKLLGSGKQTKVFPWCWYSFWVILLMVSLSSGLRNSARGLPDSAYLIIMVIIVSFVRKIRPRLIGKWSYFPKKPSAIYILLFMILLLFCVPLLIMKLDVVAGPISNIAYAFLIIGVGIEFYQLIKQENAENRNNIKNSGNT